MKDKEEVEEVKEGGRVHGGGSSGGGGEKGEWENGHCNRKLNKRICRGSMDCKRVQN